MRPDCRFSVETPEELATWIADVFGVYGCTPACTALHGEDGHPESCLCRSCFVLSVTARMRRSVAYECRKEQRREEIQQIFAILRARQQPLGEPFSTILHDNLQDLLIET